MLVALQDLRELLETRASKKIPAGWLDARRVASEIVSGRWWRRLVFPPRHPEGIVAKAVHVFRVLEQFHRHLSRHDIFATSPRPWADPRAQ